MYIVPVYTSYRQCTVISPAHQMAKAYWSLVRFLAPQKSPRSGSGNLSNWSLVKLPPGWGLQWMFQSRHNKWCCSRNILLGYQCSWPGGYQDIYLINDMDMVNIKISIWPMIEFFPSTEIQWLNQWIYEMYGFNLLLNQKWLSMDENGLSH